MAHPATVGSLPPSERASPPKVSRVERYRRDRPTAGWAWWLAGGGDDVRALRRWAFWVSWTGAARERGAALALLTLLVRPVAVARLAIRDVRQFGRRARTTGAPPLAVQFAQIMLLWARHRLRPRAYYELQCWLPERRRVAGRYVQVHQSSALLFVMRYSRRDRARSVLLDTKAAFEAWCGEHGFLSTATLATLDARDRAAASAVSLPHVDLFVKPTNWSGGRGTQRWLREAAGWRRDDEVLDEPALLATLLDDAAALDRPLLVQRLLTNAAAVGHLTLGGVCTVRVVTACPSGDPRVSPPAVVRAIYRMPSGASAADNFDAGGLAAPIDLVTGTLGPAVQKKGGLPVRTVREHPDTGGGIAGTVVPGWNEVLDLACRAHALLDVAAPVFGWDIAITPDGPVLIEVNEVPSVPLAQMPSGEPLGGTPYATAIVAGLRSTFLPR